MHKPLCRLEGRHAYYVLWHAPSANLQCKPQLLHHAFESDAVLVAPATELRVLTGTACMPQKDVHSTPCGSPTGRGDNAVSTAAQRAAVSLPTLPYDTCCSTHFQKQKQHPLATSRRQSNLASLPFSQTTTQTLCAVSLSRHPAQENHNSAPGAAPADAYCIIAQSWEPSVTIDHNPQHITARFIKAHSTAQHSP
jgi:hypothetical protein